MRFYRVTELATQLLEAREERQLTRLKSQLATLDLLVLDELGYVPASKVGAELLFDVISTAYERSSVIVTTKLPFEEWKEVLGSERLTGATLDRLTPRCTIIETGRESYRLRDARRRRRARPPARRSRPSTPGWASSSLRGPGATFFDRPALRFLPAVRHRVIPLSESRKAACLASPARVGRHNHFRSQAPRLIGSRASGPASKAITPHVPTTGKWVSSSRIKVCLHSLFRRCSSWAPNDNGTFQTPV